VRRSPATDSAAVELRKSLLGGHVRHALNRASARATLFEQPADAMQRQSAGVWRRS
jgi:hypothetical protein